MTKNFSQGIAEQQIHELNRKASFYENELMQSEEKLESLAKPTTTKKCGQYTDEMRKTIYFCARKHVPLCNMSHVVDKISKEICNQTLEPLLLLVRSLIWLEKWE